MKALITEDWLPIEFKGKDIIQVKNYIRVMMATEKKWAVPAGFEERRFSLIDMGEAHFQDRPFFRALQKQMNNGGREALLHYLLNYDISDIDLDKPYQTDALIENKLFSMSRAERFWFEILDKGASLGSTWSAKINKHALYTLYAMGAKEEQCRGGQTAFWLAVRKLSPHAREITHKGDRCMDVGSLQQCRDAFDRAINWPNHIWDPPEVETDVPYIHPLPPSREFEEYDDFNRFRPEDQSKGGEAPANG
jgi:hypothetical protein